MASITDAPPRGRPRIYIPVPGKFGIALLAAFAWMTFSIIVQSLSDHTNPVLALFAITFIALVPGFMNAFLVASLLLDRRPRRRRPLYYPAVTILIAAYQEEVAIADTLKTIAQEDYSGPIELLVLNDGSTDRTAEVAARAVEQLSFPANAEVRIINFAANRGKAAVLNAGLREAAHDLIVTIDADSRLNAASIHDYRRFWKEFFVEREIVETPLGLSRGIYYTFAGAAIDVSADDRNVFTLFAGAQAFTGDNVRTHLRANYVHVVKPEWGLSAQLRTRYFRNSEPGEFDYYSPRWYAEVLPVLQVRRFVGGWQLLGAAGYGAQRDSESRWRSSRNLNARFTSPAFRKDWAVTGGLLYTNTPVSTGFTYRYLQLNLGVTKAF